MPYGNIQPMSNKQLFHIIWTSFNEYPAWDKHGSWQHLADTYTELQKHHISYTLSHELHNVYVNKSPQKDRVLLNEKAITQLKMDIETLCQPQKDRIIDGMEIHMLHVNESAVEMLVFCNTALLAQKISRLKSRTSTLLSSKYPESYFGKGTWGKGFWCSTILNKEDLAISIINTLQERCAAV